MGRWKSAYFRVMKCCGFKTLMRSVSIQHQSIVQKWLLDDSLDVFLNIFLHLNIFYDASKVSLYLVKNFKFRLLAIVSFLLLSLDTLLYTSKLFLVDKKKSLINDTLTKENKTINFCMFLTLFGTSVRIAYRGQGSSIWFCPPNLVDQLLMFT